MNNPALDQIPLTQLKGVGPSLEKKFNQIGIFNVQDLLFHLPFRYEDRTHVHQIEKVRAGEVVQLEGEIISSNIQFGRRRYLRCVIKDQTGFISLKFFHFSKSQMQSLATGNLIRCYGEVRRSRNGMEIYHPEYKTLPNFNDIPIDNYLTPIYPSTEGLQQIRIRNAIKQAMKLMESSHDVEDHIPTKLVKKLDLEGLTEAIRLLHKPPSDTQLNWNEAGINPGQKRLAFEELLAHRLCMRRARDVSNKRKAPQLRADDKLLSQYLQALPFKLTNAQSLAYQEISKDLNGVCPMQRLLQGDVGSGKTVVAALTALHALSNGYQVAIMAPTEILAEQHLSNFEAWFTPLGISVGWLSGRTKGAERSRKLKDLAIGHCELLIGTHALFQSDVVYKKLGLIIIDEQHRFGVHQRLVLRDKAAASSINPHQLVMTATPIPRTLAMSAYADLDSSIIDELPPGRAPINTAVIPNDRRDEVVLRIENACLKHNQAYWVCTLIEESESLQCEAAEVTAEKLRKQLPEISVGLIHGRMKPKDKIEVMTDFQKGHTDLLVATTVIEVGLDVPNASLMIIENPERLGLAQLHQLRGRIGRGNIQSYCILLYQNPLSNIGKKRLSVMRDSTDGFYIAEKDLELRGPGQVLGTQQTGIMTFRVADIARDATLLDDVKEASEVILKNHNDIVEPLIKRWLGQREHYANV